LVDYVASARLASDTRLRHALCANSRVVVVARQAPMLFKMTIENKAKKKPVIFAGVAHTAAVQDIVDILTDRCELALTAAFALDTLDRRLTCMNSFALDPPRPPSHSLAWALVHMRARARARTHTLSHHSTTSHHIT
jgi:hypothetical protein